MPSAPESTIMGMPKVWQNRLTGCVWLLAYCAIHCSLVRPPSMRWIITDCRRSLRGQQKYARRTCMNVAVRTNLLMLAHVRVLQPESNDLTFVIDRESANQDCIAGKVGDHLV